MNFSEALAWLLNSGGSAIVVSWLFERWPYYQDMSAKAKETVYFVSVSLLSIGAYLALNYIPPQTIDLIAPYFQILYGIFASVVLGTYIHKSTKCAKG